MSCECEKCGKWIEHYVGHKCDEVGSSSSNALVIREKIADAAIEMLENLRDEQRPLPPEFQKVLDDNFWDLI